jgi:4-alpha-glucanotransferase
LVRQGWIKEFPSVNNLPKNRVDFGEAIKIKNLIFEEAFQTFKQRSDRVEFESFCRDSAYWLDDFALFTALKIFFHDKSWGEWPEDIRDRKPDALVYYRGILSEQIEKYRFLQFLFYGQWQALKKYANEHNIEIMGDLPIYMSYQSADLWAHPEIFKLDDEKKPLFVAGVPPDYFSKTGQLWGNPVYNWDNLKKRNFDWWVKRLSHNLKLFDLLRIDHFRGLVGYWEIPAGEKTAVNGNWMSVPAEEFFARLNENCPLSPIVAEDLGIITPDVKELIERLAIPGMRVLLFAFGEGLPENPYAPHNHIKNCVVYTGTHDNNTVKGWYEHDATPTEKDSLNRYLGFEIKTQCVHEVFVRMAMLSVADRIIIPIQDILGLGAEARMNTPSTPRRNWEWRLDPTILTDSVSKNLFDLTKIVGRLTKKK